jgi:hypothetical protein
MGCQLSRRKKIKETVKEINLLAKKSKEEKVYSSFFDVVLKTISLTVLFFPIIKLVRNINCTKYFKKKQSSFR